MSPSAPYLGTEGATVGRAGEAALDEVLGLGVAGEDLGQHALLLGGHVCGQLLDEPELLGVGWRRRRGGWPPGCRADGRRHISRCGHWPSPDTSCKG
uniref:GH3 n=1 Tax=Arundo donax TaxID=35708 RepID=A0A0A9GXQ0_ARUDO